MVVLLQIRERITRFYTSYDNYCNAAGRFILALITFLLINHYLGYSAILTNAALVLIIALACSFLPMNFLLVAAAAVTLLHIYALSLESVIVVGVAYLLMMFLYFRFSPKDSMLVILTPICFVLKVPYAIPVAAGLIGTPTSVISTGCGVAVYYILSYISKNQVPEAVTAPVTEDGAASMINKFRFIIDDLLGNKEIPVFVAAFAITILAVYLIRRLSIDRSWLIAIFAGTLLDILVLLGGDLTFKLYLSVPGMILGHVVAVAVAIVIMFFRFNVDYTRTERVQFEDDEYYYYVKAVPKNTVKPEERRVKKIKGETKKDAAEYHMRRSVTEKKESVTDRAARRNAPTDRDIRLEEARERRRAADRLERDVAAKARENRERRGNQ